MKKLNLRNDLLNREVSLTANSDVEQVIVDTAVAKGMDTSFLFEFLNVAEKHPPKLSEEDEAKYLAVAIAKLSLAWLCYMNKDTAHADIAKRINNDGDHAWFNNYFWGRRRLHVEIMRVLARVGYGPLSTDDRINDGRATSTLMRFIIGGGAGKHVGELFSTAYYKAATEPTYVEEAAREFASFSRAANVLFDTLDLSYAITQAYRARVAVKPNTVALMVCKVITADNIEEAKSKLDDALKEFSEGLHQQLEDKWGK